MKGTLRPGPPADSKPPANVDIVYSPDDGGYYCEIYGEIGQELHQTELADDIYMAANDADKWIEANGYKLGRRNNTTNAS